MDLKYYFNMVFVYIDLRYVRSVLSTAETDPVSLGWRSIKRYRKDEQEEVYEQFKFHNHLWSISGLWDALSLEYWSYGAMGKYVFPITVRLYHENNWLSNHN